MNEVKKRPLRRGMLLLAVGLGLIAALILVFLGIRAGKWAAKRDELKILTLVNASHPVPEELQQQEYALMDDGWMVDIRCAGDLQLMIDACRAEGFSPEIRDALVSRALQSERFDACVSELRAAGLSAEEAGLRAGELMPPPGYSEHELGLAVDLADADLPDEEQGASPMHAYLAENSWRYGFIQRYPEGKREATGLGYVPWHYRYVGREAAQQIFELGLTLDEYIDLFYPEQTD